MHKVSIPFQKVKLVVEAQLSDPLASLSGPGDQTTKLASPSIYWKQN